MLDEITLYERILDLEKTRFVEAVELVEGKQTATVFVAFDDATQLFCPTCGKTCAGYDERRRQWQHLDSCQLKTLVDAEVPRV